jgi:hypothetical protein
MLGNSGTCLSLAALAVRSLLPDWFSVAVTNGGALARGVLLLDGNREFVHLPAACPSARILFVLGMLAQVYFLVGADDIGSGFWSLPFVLDFKQRRVLWHYSGDASEPKIWLHSYRVAFSGHCVLQLWSRDRNLDRLANTGLV